MFTVEIYPFRWRAKDKIICIEQVTQARVSGEFYVVTTAKNETFRFPVANVWYIKEVGEPKEGSEAIPPVRIRLDGGI